MEEIDYLVTYNEDETEKIFDDWTETTAHEQTRGWIHTFILPVIGIVLWIFTEEFLYFVLFCFWDSVSYQLISIHRRQTRIAKYLTYLKNRK